MHLIVRKIGRWLGHYIRLRENEKIAIRKALATINRFRFISCNLIFCTTRIVQYVNIALTIDVSGILGVFFQNIQCSVEAEGALLYFACMQDTFARARGDRVSCIQVFFLFVRYLCLHAFSAARPIARKDTVSCIQVFNL